MLKNHMDNIIVYFWNKYIERVQTLVNIYLIYKESHTIKDHRFLTGKSGILNSYTFFCSFNSNSMNNDPSKVI